MNGCQISLFPKYSGEETETKFRAEGQGPS